MDRPKHKICALFALAVVLFLICGWSLPTGGAGAASGVSVQENITAAQDLTKQEGVRISVTDMQGNEKEDLKQNLIDRDRYSASKFSSGDRIVINIAEGKAAGLYLIWDKIPGEWYLHTADQMIPCGTEGYLHEYIVLPEQCGALSIVIPKTVSICELYLFSEGLLPDWVQVWQPPYEQADILLLPTHTDDEHLFFAGILPYYAGEVGARVQVVYMTHHFDTQERPHEQLDGLWTVGVRHYPVISEYADDAGSYGDRSMDPDQVLRNAFAIYDRETVTAFQVEMLRRFRPLVVIGHDVNGEYGHGAHRVNTITLQDALLCSGDPKKYPGSAERYGVWDVPKTYLHLWEENPIVMNWDVPLAHFGGLTAFEVSQRGYACHDSQQWTWFTKWIKGTDENPITKASQISTYSPCRYGLYRSLVGPDTGKQDFLENIKRYADPTPAPAETPALQSPGPSAPVSPSPSDRVVSTAVNGTPAASDSSASKISVSILLLIGAGVICIVLLSAIIVRNRRG